MIQNARPLDVGTISEHHVGDSDDAMERYLQAYRLDPTVPSMLSLESASIVVENWVMVDKLMERRLDMAISMKMS